MSDVSFSYGVSYEYKLLSAVLKDKQFFIDIHEILKPKYFSDEYNKDIYQLITEYFLEYKNLPDLDYFKIKVEDFNKGDEYRQGFIESLKNIIVNLDSYNADHIKDHAKDFCKNQKMKDALYESVDLLKNADYDSIFSLMKDAVSSGIDNDVGHKYKDNILSKYEESVRNVIATPWETINDVIGGGVGGGEFHVVAGLPGTGKSWFLVSMGAYAIQNGYNVMHYTLELSEDYTAFRYDANILKESIDKLKYKDKDYIVDSINSNVSGNLIIKSMPSYNTTVDTLEMHLDKCSLVDEFKPDLIIIDYPDLMIPTKRNKRHNSREDQDIQTIYREIRGFAMRSDIPFLGVSQINKKGMEDDYITEDKLAASFGKLMEADFVMSFSRKAEDLLSDSCRFMILKNRFGPDKLKFNGKFISNIGHIEIYYNSSKKDESINNYMKGEEDSNTRLELKRRYDDLFGDD